MRRRASKSSKPASALSRLGLAAPPPFVGRTEELAALGRALREQELLVMHGAVGSGKTRLGREIARRPEVLGSLRPAYVPCRPGDRGVAVKARAERALDVLPGSLSAALRHQPALLIIDDVHHLVEDDITRLLADLVPSGAEGRALLLTRDVLPMRRDRGRFEMNLDGLDETAARDLWHHHEETYGPTTAGAVDKAITRTRGMPLALRREYARAVYGDAAWDIAELGDDERRALEAVAVIRIPAAPAAVAALVPEIARTEAALIELVSRQLIDPCDDGRFAIHDVVRDEVLAAMDPGHRAAVERSAAELVSSVGRGRADARRLAWDAGDDGAVGLIDPVDRMREAVLHLLAAGDVDAAAARLVQDRAIAARRGGGGEIIGLIDSLEAAGARDIGTLEAVRAEIAARQGRVSEALEICLREASRDALDEVETAELLFRSGEVVRAADELTELLDHETADVRCRAAAALSQIHLRRGRWADAHQAATEAFERNPAGWHESTRALLHLALASVEYHAGRVTAARAALSRAASSGRLDPALAALIEARRATCLAREGRVSEAESTLREAEQVASEVEAVVVADEIRRCAAMVDARRGDTIRATDTLRDLVTRRRQRGDEVGALGTEIDLVLVLVERGELRAASELAIACRSSAERRGLRGMAALAALASAAIDLSELRLESARAELHQLVVDETAEAEVRARAASLLRQVNAHLGDDAEIPEVPVDEGRDEIDALRIRAALALALGDSAVALDCARSVAVRAERAGRRADLAEALSMMARLQLARGDRAAATSSATRAAREALACGLTRARAAALLVLAALERDEGNVAAASAYAQDASPLALEAGLPIERLVAAEALEAIAGGDTGADTSGVRNAAAAIMSQPALDAAARLLSDLGLTAVRPFRVVSSSGSESFVADANPDLLRMPERSLAIDGVREMILRAGRKPADLRRRSLLKRLLFLFASSPARVFSKEEIVETVWEVEYHPLRHDAALFTNIMRIRRLLGKDGADLIRVSEDGYRFVPPKDFIFVEAVSA